jgi:amino acid transporter
MTAWFVPKRYGYGATPVTWQGWTLTAVFFVLVILVAALLLRGAPLSAKLAAFFAVEAVLVAAMWIISYRTTAGAWRWGNTSDADDELGGGNADASPDRPQGSVR